MSKAGNVDIIVSGAEAPDNGHTNPEFSKNYNIVYQKGTLSIRHKGSGGGGGGGSTTPTPSPDKPTPPTTVEHNITTKIDNNGKATATVQDKDITNAISKALTETNKNGITITLNVKTDKSATSLETTLSAVSVKALINAGVTELSIKNDLSIVTLDLATLKTLIGGEIKLNISKINMKTLSAEAQKAIGNRPVFKLEITVGGKPVTDFNVARVTLKIPYTLTANETAGNLVGVFVDSNGKVNWLENSSFNPSIGAMLTSTTHFSIFGIGYKESNSKFTDTTNHWAKTDIDFVTARGLLNSITTTTFAPYQRITRGMLVTALGKLANVDINSYKTAKFTDVKTDAYYAPYVNWAAEKGILKGITTTTFAPEQAITRQEMAIIMSSYTKALGYKVPETRTVVTYADSSSIASEATIAVKQMQMAGVLNGKNNNRFEPTGTATRAEVSAILHRFVELIIDRTTTEGWTINDSGSSLYYQNGNALTGTRTVGNVAYSFNSYGETNRKPVTTTPTSIPTNNSNRNLTHIVKKNEYFGVIAKQYGCTVDELTALNGKKYGDIIHVGDELKIPQK